MKVTDIHFINNWALSQGPAFLEPFDKDFPGTPIKTSIEEWSKETLDGDVRLYNHVQVPEYMYVDSRSPLVGVLRYSQKSSRKSTQWLKWECGSSESEPAKCSSGCATDGSGLIVLNLWSDILHDNICQSGFLGPDLLTSELADSLVH